MKNSFVLFTDDYDLLEQLNPERIGNVMMAIFRYERGEEIQELDMAEAVAFAAIRKHVDILDKEYEKKVEARSAAGKRGMESRWKNSGTITNDNKPLQTITNDNKSENQITKITDTDTVTDTDIKEKKEKEKRERFEKPSVDDVREYCKERGNGVDPAAFVDFYESKGWKVGNQPMKDWKACVRTWEKRKKEKPPNRFNNFDQRNDDIDAAVLEKLGGILGEQ